jgi:hypothetical protein
MEYSRVDFIYRALIQQELPAEKIRKFEKQRYWITLLGIFVFLVDEEGSKSELVRSGGLTFYGETSK